MNPDLTPETTLSASVADDYTTTGHDHPQTSHEAARTVVVHSGTQRHRVLQALGSYSTTLSGTARAGLTDVELQRVLDMSPNSERPRRVELMQADMVAALRNERDEVVTRQHYGSAHIVWAITRTGLDALAALGE